MTLYILDTDHLSLYGRNHPQVIERLRTNQVQLTTTAINVEEQLRGRLAQVAQAREGAALSNAYEQLINTVMLCLSFRCFRMMQILTQFINHSRLNGCEWGRKIYELLRSRSPTLVFCSPEICKTLRKFQDLLFKIGRSRCSLPYANSRYSHLLQLFFGTLPLGSH